MTVKTGGASEKQLRLEFSEDYKEYLRCYGYISFEGHELTGICKFPRLNVVDVTLEERKRNPDIPKNWYVVEQTHIDGIVIWQASTGEIYQFSLSSEPLMLCDSLASYIEME